MVALAFFLIPGVAETQICEGLFEARPAVTAVESRIFEWPVEHVMPPRIEGDRLTSSLALHKKFKEAFDAMSAGKLALEHMRTLPSSMSARDKAKTWIELVNHIANYEFILFTSEMYRLPDGRYLFRGATGDALFVDNDGAMYRTRTWPLDRDPIWEVDYSKLRPLN